MPGAGTVRAGQATCARSKETRAAQPHRGSAASGGREPKPALTVPVLAASPERRRAGPRRKPARIIACRVAQSPARGCAGVVCIASVIRRGWPTHVAKSAVPHCDVAYRSTLRITLSGYEWHPFVFVPRTHPL